MTITTSTYDGVYSDSWKQFLATWNNINGKKRDLIMSEERDRTGTLSIILSAQRHYVRTRSTADARIRIERRIHVAIEAGRMIVRRTRAQRVRTDIRALRTLGGPYVYVRTKQERLETQHEARKFWRKVDAGLPAKRVAREQANHYRLWRALHPTDEATTEEDLQEWKQLRREVRQLAGATRTAAVKPHLGFVPVGSMTRERALQIAVAALQNVGR